MVCHERCVENQFHRVLELLTQLRHEGEKAPALKGHRHLAKSGSDRFRQSEASLFCLQVLGA